MLNPFSILKKPVVPTVQCAVVGETVVAESKETQRVEGNHYFPPESVNWDYLEPSNQTSVCPWKGVARYYDVVARLPGVKHSPKGDSFRGLVGFGASYGVASLSCTLPIFLSLTAGAVAGRSLFESISVFLAYGAGMSLVVISLTIFLAVGRESVLRRVRPLAAHLGTISGWTLILAGGFIVWYWATVLGTGAETLGANPFVRWIEQTSSDVAQLVAANPAAAALVVSGAAALGWISIRRMGSGDREHHQAKEEPESVGR